MLHSTYIKIMNLFAEHNGGMSNGYLYSSVLKNNNVTSAQINELIRLSSIRKISHGLYQWIDPTNDKPENYKFIEICLVNNDAVICGESALFYHGLIDTEPENVSVATKRSDRSALSLPFAINRHFITDNSFEEDIENVPTPYGSFRIYKPERSIVDMIRFSPLPDELTQTSSLADYYKSMDSEAVLHLTVYADKMKYGTKVREYLDSLSLPE